MLGKVTINVNQLPLVQLKIVNSHFICY